MISDAAQNSRFERDEANQRELLGKLEGLEAADVYLQVIKVLGKKNGKPTFLAAFGNMKKNGRNKESYKTSCTFAPCCICYLHLISCMHAYISAKVAERS